MEFLSLNIRNEHFPDSHQSHQNIDTELYFSLSDFYIVYPERMLDLVHFQKVWNFYFSEEHTINAILCVINEIKNFIAELIKKITIIVKKVIASQFLSLRDIYLQLDKDLHEITFELKTGLANTRNTWNSSLISTSHTRKETKMHHHFRFFQNLRMLVDIYVKNDCPFYEIIKIKVVSCHYINVLSRELSTISYFLTENLCSSSQEIADSVLYFCLLRLHNWFSFLYSIWYNSKKTMLDWLETLLFESGFQDMHMIVHSHNQVLKYQQHVPPYI